MQPTQTHTAATLERGTLDRLDVSHAMSQTVAAGSLTYDEPLITLGTAPFPDDPWWKRFSPTTFFALVSGAIAVLFLIEEMTVAGTLGFPLDDAWAHLVYARNFFRHIAFEFNPGEHTAGPTAPLWTVFEALSYGLFKDPFIAAKLIGAIFLFLTGYYAFRLFRALKVDYGFSLIAGLMVLTIPRLAWAELGGMECTLSSALVMGGLWWHFSRPRGWQRYLTGIVFALATLARPESALVFVLLLFSMMLRLPKTNDGSRLRAYPWTQILLTILAFVLVLLPVLFTNFAISGSWVPQTFVAGMTNDSLVMLIAKGDVATIATRLLTSLLTFPYVIGGIYLQDNPVLVSAIVWAAVITRKKRFREDAVTPLFRFGSLVLLLFPYLRSLILGIDSEFGEHARWVAFLSPVYIITGLAAVRLLIERYVLRGLQERTTVFVAAGAVAATSLAVLVANNLLYLPVNHSWGYQFAEPSVGTRLLGLHRSFSLVPIILLFSLISTFTLIALRHARLNLLPGESKKRVYSNEELDNMSFEVVDHDDDEDMLPASHLRLLRGILLITLTWNLTELPRVADDYALEVRATNKLHVETARFVAATTQPSDIIATNAIGTLGWFSERRVLDTQGLLDPNVLRDRKVLGATAATESLLARDKPAYLLLYGTSDAPVRDGVAAPLPVSGPVQLIKLR